LVPPPAIFPPGSSLGQAGLGQSLPDSPGNGSGGLDLVKIYLAHRVTARDGLDLVGLNFLKTCISSPRHLRGISRPNRCRWVYKEDRFGVAFRRHVAPAATLRPPKSGGGSRGTFSWRHCHAHPCVAGPYCSYPR
jgi:hypothetical protein